MTLHPIAVVDKVIEEYRSYLKTEFRARDPGLRQALDDALDQPRFLAQEPFFQAHRPFKEGARWRELPLDGRLAQAMVTRSRSERAWLHQAQAITWLLGPEPGPLVVITGTGDGKTECFLLPVIQNAIEDSVRFRRSGLTALLIYPMNALDNDQEERIKELLDASGHTHVRIGRYDRSTKEDDRERWRREPPHILLTNYMMLEYLMVRAADRDPLFANHRCRFVVLDEVHSYRGTLDSNIALLMRRLYSHLSRARQDWSADDRADAKRFPTPITVATSATIKSVEEGETSPEEMRRSRDAAVQDFLGKLTGIEGNAFLVIGEEVQDLVTPPTARWPSDPAAIHAPDPHHPAGVIAALAALAADQAGAEPAELAQRAAILWTLNELLARKPMAVSGIVDEILAKVPERKGADRPAVEREALTALVTGAALPDGVAGALRLRTHRFIRGGWHFHRCVDPACGRLYPMGEELCACGRPTAPLYICRNCGADTLRFKEQADAGPTGAPLQPNDSRAREGEWMLYDRSRFAEAGGEDKDDIGLVGIERQMRGRQVLTGSF